MQFYDAGKRWLLALIALFLLLVMLTGCAIVGPRSISSGRAAYAEAINKTEDEQILLSIVKGRYGETSSLLALSGVASSMSFSATAGVEAGFGATENSGENLLIGGLAYEENPTITYAPVQGEKYIRELTSPIPLDILMLSLRSETFSDRLLTLLVNRINDLRNPSFLTAPSAQQDQRFVRFVELYTELHNAGLLDIVKNSQSDGVFDVFIYDYSPQYTTQVLDFLTLLDLPIPLDESKELVIPTSFSINSKKSWSLGITTRSTFDLIEILRAAIEVPPEHAEMGLPVKYPPVGLPGQGVRINSSRKKPNDMSLAVLYRGYWFYCSETDQKTKAFFSVLRMLWSISIAGAVDQRDAPVLTLPVGR
jgi:hypothetical protein